MSENDRLPTGWITTVLKEIAEIRDDLREPVNAKERANRQGPYPYYGATGQVGWIDGYLMDGEYVLLGEDGVQFLDSNKAKAYMVSGKCWVNNHAHVLKATEGLTENRFLLYALNAADYQGHVNGTTRLKLTQGAMRLLPIRLPPLLEQRRIVQKIEELFSKLDAGVTALERIQIALKRYRAAVLKAAVEGKLTAEWRAKHPDIEPASELLQRILSERRRKWEQEQRAKYKATGKESPKGWQAKYKEPAGPETNELVELPEGWCRASMEQLVERSEYGTSVKCDYGADGPPVLRIPNIARGRIDLSDLKRAKSDMELVPQDALQAGDLLMCRTNGSIGLIGKAALVPETYTPSHGFASYLLRFRFVDARTAPRWVHMLVGSSQGRKFIETRAASSAGQHNISLTLIHSMLVQLPPLKEQEEIVAEVDRRLSIVDRLEAQVEANLTRAARLRQSILKRAFEGRLVPQDPRDEPAELLLECIRRQRTSTTEPRPTTMKVRRTSRQRPSNSQDSRNSESSP